MAVTMSTQNVFASPDLDVLGVEPSVIDRMSFTDQKIVSQIKLLHNIHPEDSAPGVIIASPSRQYPNYYFPIG